MMAKIVIVLTLLVVITEARFLDRERDFFQDTSKRSCNLGETVCSNDSQCQSWCGNRTVICNYIRRCNYSSFIDDVIRSKPCYSIGLWKSPCTSNSDCRCNEGNGLVCEDNECVEPPRTDKMTVWRHRL
ncbi:unnamed protein product [Porites evermanni]|uniref:Uncharacterized protein n=1 Tax=Porites evermanni TaxID=104178 RepID=A0ABN8QI52_9CNID|nr:unnamed protein product [Porites evermanni]